MSTDTQAITSARPEPSTKAAAPAIDLSDFFSAAEARMDSWRQLCAVARAWQSAAARGKPEDALFAEAVGLFGSVAPLEAFFAYPGSRLMGTIEQALAERNAGVCVRLVQHVSTALLTGAVSPRPVGVGSDAGRTGARQPICCRRTCRPATGRSRTSKRSSSRPPNTRSGSAPGTR